MNRTTFTRVLVLGASLVVCGQTQRQPTIRTGIISVPIDVRVVDRNDKPITDLKQEDFTVLEEGVPQQIRPAVKWPRTGQVMMPSDGSKMPTGSSTCWHITRQLWSGMASTARCR